MGARVELQWHGEKVARRGRGGAAKGLRKAAEYGLSAANLRVPHERGTLERSGSTDVDPDNLRAAVSYDTPYAVYQHEVMDLHHDGKGEAKWLENTLTGESEQFVAIIGQAIRDEIGG